MRSWTMSLRSFLSTWKGVALWTARSALASAFLSACSASQSHSRGGWCSGPEAMEDARCGEGRDEEAGAEGAECARVGG